MKKLFNAVEAILFGVLVRIIGIYTGATVGLHNLPTSVKGLSEGMWLLGQISMFTERQHMCLVTGAMVLVALLGTIIVKYLLKKVES